MSARQPDLVKVNKITGSYHRVEIKESEKRDKYLQLLREIKKKQTINVTVIPIVIVKIRTIPKELVHGLEDFEIKGEMETIQT